MAKKVLVEIEGPVTTVIINRPEARNACDQDVLALLWEAFRAFEEDEGQKAMVLTGTGGYFCAGADLKELSTGKGIGFSWASRERGITRHHLSKPVIGAVEGYALAAGLALAVWCDMRVVGDETIFGVFCRRWGVPMPNGGSVRLARLIGQSRALDMFLTGRGVDAQEALSFGLANRVVPKGTARQHAEDIARTLAAFPQTAMLTDRESLISQWGHPLDVALCMEVELAQKAFYEESQSGAGNFARGAGRHGVFAKPADNPNCECD